MKTTLLTILAILVCAASGRAVILRQEQSPGTTTGWVASINLPDDLPEIRGLIVVGNGAGADESGVVNDAELMAFARSIGFGVLGLGRWSNLYSSTERTRFLSILSTFATQSNRPELVNVPWIAFGFSQGGGQAYSLNYHFPARTIAIGVNKAGFSFLNGGSDTGRLDQTGVSGRPPSADALKTPALLVAAALDDPGRITNLTDAFNNNRAQGAPWAMLIEDGVGHEKGRAYQWMLPFLAEAVALRYPSNQSPAAGPVTLSDVNQAPGWLINHATQSSGFLQVEAQSGFSGNLTTRGWVPSERIARFAQAFGSYAKVGTITPSTSTGSPQIAPLALTYGVDLSGQAGWSKVEFFDGSTKLGEAASSGGDAPAVTRTIAASTGFFSTYAIVTLGNSTQRFTPLQTLWVNGGTGFTMVPGAPEATWAFRSTGNNTGNISGSWGNATNWSTGSVPGAQNLRANFAALDFGATSTISLDGTRTAGYLQFGDAAGGQWTTLSSGASGSLTLNVTSGSAVIQLAPGSGQTLHFNGVSPTGTSPLELIGNGDPGAPNIMILALAGTYGGSVTVRNALDWHVSNGSAFGSNAQGTSVQAGSVLTFREWVGNATYSEPLILSGFGQTGKPALRIGTGSSANHTVTFTGNLTLEGPVAVGVSSSLGNGTALSFANRLTTSGSNRTLFIGYLRSQAGDGTLPAWGLDTGTLDDAAGTTTWGAVNIEGNATFGNSGLDRVVLGLGWLRLRGANDRLPVSTRVVLNAASTTNAATLRWSKLTLAGVSQELAGLDSYFGANSSNYTISVAGGAPATGTLVLNLTVNSTFSGFLGGNGTDENNLVLEKRGPATLALTANNTFTGPTRILGGTLAIPRDATLGAAPAASVADQLLLGGGGTLDVDGNATLAATRGITLAAGGGVFRCGANLATAAPVTGNGSLTKAGNGTLTLSGNVNHSGGTIVSAGVLSLTGSASLPGGGLTVQAGARVSATGSANLSGSTILRRSSAGGTAPLQAGGTVSLSGSLLVELAGYSPVLGDVIPLINAGSLSGNFTTVLLPRTSSGPAFRLERTATELRMRVVATSFENALFRAGILGSSQPVGTAMVTADADGDGMPNLLEYAFGGAISVPDTSPVGPSIATDRLAVSFPRDSRATDVSLFVEAASAPGGPWTAIAQNVRGAGWTGPASVNEGAPDSSGRVTVTVQDVGTSFPRFLRVRSFLEP